jgi:hypothetical protein
MTIFSNFQQFSAKKLAFFSKTNVMIKFVAEFSFVFESKMPNCLPVFIGENILKIITSVPGCGDVYYCGRDHQSKDWPAHKLNCRSWRVQTDKTGARGR